MSETAPIKIGFDVGNVILRNDTDTPALPTFSDVLGSPQRYVDGSVDTIARIVSAVSSDNAYLISKCGPSMEQRTLSFFADTDFYGHTGINPANVLFCRRREEKAPIASKLGLSHFADDRLEILRIMTSVKTKMLFQRPDRQPLNEDILQGEDRSIRIARNWGDVWRIVCEGM